MKIRCNRDVLHEAVQLAASIVPGRTPKPILQCAKLEADQEAQKLTVVATDGDITITYSIDQVQVEQSGAVVIPASRISAILHETTDETVNLEVIGAACQIMAKDSRFRIFGDEPGDFPVVSSAEKEVSLQIKADLLSRLIRLTTFAAARESSRYAINGVLWEIESKKLVMVATDGRRLAQALGEVAPSATGLSQTAIVPVKLMVMLARVLNDPDEQVGVDFSSNQVSMWTSRVELRGNLAQGRFPKYADVIPQQLDKKARVGAEALRSAIRRVALLTNESSRGVLLTFENSRLQLSSSTPEAGEAEVNMEIEYGGDKFQIGFNPQYVLEVLRVIEEPEVICEFSDASKPGLMRAGKGFLYVLMPVTV